MEDIVEDAFVVVQTSGRLQLWKRGKHSSFKNKELNYTHDRCTFHKKNKMQTHSIYIHKKVTNFGCTCIRRLAV